MKTLEELSKPIASPTDVYRYMSTAFEDIKRICRKYFSEGLSNEDIGKYYFSKSLINGGRFLIERRAKEKERYFRKYVSSAFQLLNYNLC